MPRKYPPTQPRATVVQSTLRCTYCTAVLIVSSTGTDATTAPGDVGSRAVLHPFPVCKPFTLGV